MTVKYKDFMIRWVFKASWTYLEGAMLLDEKDPDTFTSFVPNKKASDRVNVLYYWLVKQHQMNELHADSDEEPLTTTPGEIMRAVHQHRQVYSKDFYALWVAIRYGKKNNRILSDVTWGTYLKAVSLIKRRYPEATKDSIAKALNELPKHFRFSNGQLLTPYGTQTLSRKLRGLTDNKAGRPRKHQQANIDIALIAKEMSQN